MLGVNLAKVGIMKYSEVKKIYAKAWHMYLDPCFDGKDVARMMIEIIELKARLTPRAGDVCHVCGAKLPALTKLCVVCGTRA